MDNTRSLIPLNLDPLIVETMTGSYGVNGKWTKMLLKKV